MASVWEPRFSELVKALASLRESTALELLPDVMPVLDVLADDPEYAFQRGERYCFAYQFVNAVAGQYGAVRLANPSTSRTLIVLQRVRYGSAAGIAWGNLYVGTNLGTLANRTAMDGRDGRHVGTTGVAGNVVGVVSSGNAAGSLVYAQNAVHACMQPGTNHVDVLMGDVIIPPGWCYTVESAGVNVTLGVELMWEERPGCNADELKVK